MILKVNKLDKNNSKVFLESCRTFIGKASFQVFSYWDLPGCMVSGVDCHFSLFPPDSWCLVLESTRKNLLSRFSSTGICKVAWIWGQLSFLFVPTRKLLMSESWEQGSEWYVVSNRTTLSLEMSQICLFANLHEFHILRVYLCVLLNLYTMRCCELLSLNVRTKQIIEFFPSFVKSCKVIGTEQSTVFWLIPRNKI